MQLMWGFCALQEAKKLFMVLKAKLDGLSHLGLGRKPVTSELEVNVDAAAIAMEDVAPVIVSAAHLRAPEEVHAKVCAAVAIVGVPVCHLLALIPYKQSWQPIDCWCELVTCAQQGVRVHAQDVQGKWKGKGKEETVPLRPQLLAALARVITSCRRFHEHL